MLPWHREPPYASAFSSPLPSRPLLVCFWLLFALFAVWRVFPESSSSSCLVVSVCSGRSSEIEIVISGERDETLPPGQRISKTNLTCIRTDDAQDVAGRARLHASPDSRSWEGAPDLSWSRTAFRKKKRHQWCPSCSLPHCQVPNISDLPSREQYGELLSMGATRLSCPLPPPGMWLSGGLP